MKEDTISEIMNNHFFELFKGPMDKMEEECNSSVNQSILISEKSDKKLSLNLSKTQEFKKSSDLVLLK